MVARTKWIRLRASEDEFDAIYSRAEKLGLTVSDFIRQATTGVVQVRVIDSEAAFELRRIGAMLKSMYPKDANWTAEEKRRYWQALETLLGYAEKLAKGTSKE